MPTPHRIYLDYNATVPLRRAAREAMLGALDLTGNPSSVHDFGRAARRIVEDARESVAALCGCTPAEIVFTSGATEANNLALRGSGRPRVVASAIEHESVLAAAPGAETVPCSDDGRIDADALSGILGRDDRAALVSLMLANNETGIVQPVARLAQIAHAAGALVHCDAVQAVGRIPVDRESLGVDYLSLSSHKIGGPQGAGALVCAAGAPLTATAVGGGQERRRRAGTENVAAIAGFGAAAAEAAAMRDDQPRLAALRDRLEAGVAAAAPEARFFARSVPRLANTSCVAMPGIRSEAQVMVLDLQGIAVSAGAACSSGKVAVSHVLSAMGVDADLAGCAIRISLGWQTTEADVDAFVQAWCALHRRRSARAAE